MSTLRYVRIIRMGSMVEPGAKRRSRWKELEALRDGDWIEGTLIKPIRIGEGFQVRTFIHNGQLCRRGYLTSEVVAIQGDQVLRRLGYPGYSSSTRRVSMMPIILSP